MTRVVRVSRAPPGCVRSRVDYPWAYYSVLVAHVDTLLFDSVVLSGWVLNFIFRCGQIFFVYRILSLLHLRQPRVFWTLVLFVISISFHNFRNYLMRDQGFILFIMAGTYYSLAYISEYKKYSPTIMLIDKAREDANSLGFKFLHLGGGLANSKDSLFHFKSGFSKKVKKFYVFKMITNDFVYKKLSKLSADNSTTNENFFPLYRSLNKN